MPMYDYQCSGCKEIFEEFRTIALRKEPETLKCPACGQLGTVFQAQIAPPPLVSGVNETSKLMDNGFKEVMKGVKKANPNCNIKDY